jgi:hypothetical protein
VIQETKSLLELHIGLENPRSLSFNQTIIEAVDLTFSKLGSKVKQTLYYSLTIDYKLNKEDIPCRTKEFIDAIEGIFGKSALLLEIDLMKNLSQKVPAFKCETSNPKLTFCEYLKSLQSYMETS